GKLIPGDDPRLDPLWARCGELGIPVLIHMADPKEYWYPLTPNTFHYGMKAESSQFYDRDKMPSWEELIRQRNNILKKHPKTKFIGAHMGSLTFDLKQLGETFDKYPNFHVDCSARTRILGRLNPQAVRDFFTKYQDRILFGTDSSVLNNVKPSDAAGVAAWQDRAARFYARHLEYFETNQVGLVEPYGWGKEWLRITGVKLPPEVLEKFYHGNAERLIPGLARAEPRGAADTELGKLAASMKPGTWAELKTDGLTADLLKVQNHHILEYTAAGTWAPKSQQFLFVGQGHYSALKFIRFDAAANTWKLLPTPSWWQGDAETGKGPIGHAYYNNTIDPDKGLLYHHQSATRLVHRYDVAKDEWTTLPEIKDAATGHGTAIAYFPERNGLVRVLGGNVHCFDEGKQAWSKLNTEKLAMGPYHNVARYSPGHQLVLFGGGNGSKHLYTLDAQGNIARLDDAPVEIGINTALVTVDPVTGDFLVLHRDDKFFALNPSTGKWRELSTEGMPFAMKGSSFDVIAAPVKNHGVTMFVTAPRKGLKVCLYKHAAAK
ncbi:MAG: amidohydrolase family protein, partial [Gemmataceae bacterium]